MAERLLDRLEDCKRTFPRVAVLGGAAGAVVSRLSGGRAGIESAVLLDSSSAMLDRCRQQVKLKSVRKIGEGTFGEAFKGGDVVFKIVPMEGAQLVRSSVRTRLAQLTCKYRQ